MRSLICSLLTLISFNATDLALATTENASKVCHTDLGSLAQAAQSETSPTNFFTRNLSATELEKVALRTGEEKFVPQIVSALQQADWSLPLLQPDHPNAEGILRAALRALEENRITLSQLATMVLRWQAHQDLNLPVKTAPLIERRTRKLTPIALALFSEDTSSSGSFLNPDQTARFELELAAIQEASETQLSYVLAPTATIHMGAGGKKMDFTSVLAGLDGHVVFSSSKTGSALKVPEHQSALIFPSVSVTNAFLTAKFDKPLLLTPELGLASTENLARGLLANRRCMGLTFPEIEPPEKVDGFPSNRIGLTQHDVYHAFIGNQVDPTYRLILARALLAIDPFYSAGSGASSLPFAFIPSEIKDKDQTWDRLGPLLIDVNPRSRARSKELANSSTGQKLLYDFGPIGNGHLGFVIRDMVLNREPYRQMGIEVEKTLQEMGTDAVEFAKKLESKSN